MQIKMTNTHMKMRTFTHNGFKVRQIGKCCSTHTVVMQMDQLCSHKNCERVVEYGIDMEMKLCHKMCRRHHSHHHEVTRNHMICIICVYIHMRQRCAMLCFFIALMKSIYAFGHSKSLKYSSEYEFPLIC